MRQVLENTESTRRQYALRARAGALGWAAERVVVIVTVTRANPAPRPPGEKGLSSWSPR